MNVFLKRKYRLFVVSTGMLLIFLGILYKVQFPPINVGIQITYSSEMPEGQKVVMDIDPAQKYVETDQVVSYVANHQSDFYLNSQLFDLRGFQLFFKDLERVSIERLTIFSGAPNSKKVKLLSIYADELQKNLSVTEDTNGSHIIFSNSVTKKIQQAMIKRSPVKIYLLIVAVVLYLAILMKKFLFKKTSKMKFTFFYASSWLFVFFCFYVFQLPMHDARGVDNFQLIPDETETILIKQTVVQEFEANAGRMDEVTFHLGQNKKIEGAGTILVSLYDKETGDLIKSGLYESNLLDNAKTQTLRFNPVDNSQYKKYILKFELLHGSPGKFTTKGNLYSINDGWAPADSDGMLLDLVVEVAPRFALYDARGLILIISISILLIIGVAIYYQKMRLSPKKVSILIYCLVFLYAVFQINFYQERFRSIPDENAHISYVAYFAEHPDKFLPDYEEMQIGYVEGETGNLVLNDGPNYLGHPPLYYKLLSLIKGVEKTGDHFVVHTNRMVLVSVLFVLTALLLMMYIGFTRLKEIPIIHYLYGMILISVPMFLYGSGGVTNDSLTILTVTLGIFGLLRYAEKKHNLLTYGLIATGICGSLLTKITAGLLLVVVSISFVFYLLLKEKKIQFLMEKQFWYTLPFYLLTAGYFLLVYKQIGSIQVSYERLAPDQFYRSGFYVSVFDRVNKNIFDYTYYYFTQFFRTWTAIASSKTVFHTGPWYDFSRIGIMLIVIVPFLIFFINKRDEKIYFAKSIMIGLTATFLLQFFNAINSFYRSGYLGSYQSRYYLCGILGMGLISVWILESLAEDKADIYTEIGPERKFRMKGKTLLSYLAGIWIVVLGYSGFIYFLIHFKY